jgi:hypothetical protein
MGSVGSGREMPPSRSCADWSSGTARFAAIIATLATAIPSARAQQKPPEWQASVSSEFRFFSYDTRRRGAVLGVVPFERGHQSVQSFGAELSGYPSPDLKLGFTLRGGMVQGRTTNQTVSGSFSGLTDTVFSGTATYLGLAGFQPFVSLNLNLPTGTSNPGSSDAKAKGDIDLIPRPTFGEGFNIGPSVGFNLPIDENLVASVSAGYTARGRYDREPDTVAPLVKVRVDPGDVATLSATLGWKGERLSLKGSAAYSVETTTRHNGVPFYRAGDRIILQAGAGYAFSEAWSTRAQVSYSHYNQNKVQVAGLPPLVLEAFNSNNDIFRINADLTYRSGSWTLGPVASYTHRARNGYDPTAFEYVTSRNTASIGLAGGYAATQSIRLSARVERIWSSEAASPDKVVGGFPVAGTAVPSGRTRGWQASGSAGVKF